MRIDELPEFLEDELSYPVDHDAAVERVGAVEIEATEATETETVAAVVESVGQKRYGSADELFATVIGNLSDEYIGRKFYDDRGGDLPDAASGPTDEADSTF